MPVTAFWYFATDAVARTAASTLQPGTTWTLRKALVPWGTPVFEYLPPD